MIFTMPFACAAQRKRILRARGLQAQRKHSGDGVGLVGDREHGAFERARHRIVHRLRLVLIVDGVADGIAVASARSDRVPAPCAYKPADDALQLGELLHQLGGQIGLGQQRGFVNHCPDGTGVPALR